MRPVVHHHLSIYTSPRYVDNLGSFPFASMTPMMIAIEASIVHDLGEWPYSTLALNDATDQYLDIYFLAGASPEFNKRLTQYQTEIIVLLSSGKKSSSGGNNILTLLKSNTEDDAGVRPSGAWFLSPEAVFARPESWKSGA